MRRTADRRLSAVIVLATWFAIGCYSTSLVDGLEGRLKVALPGAELGVNAQALETGTLRVNLLPNLRAYAVREDDDHDFDEISVDIRKVQAVTWASSACAPRLSPRPTTTTTTTTTSRG